MENEVTFEELSIVDRAIISRTDLNGVITFANKAFCTLSGYTKAELIGQPHSIVRHPNMPKIAFQKMWQTIEANHRWRGFIKNLRKDGRYYWTEAFIEPFFDENDQKIGYMEARNTVSESDKNIAEQEYKTLLKEEKNL